MLEHDSGGIEDPQVPEPGKVNPEHSILWPVKGTIINVIPIDSPDNGTGELMCDVLLTDFNYTLFRLPIYTPAFHKDTDPATDQLARQNAAPRTRGVYDGEAWTPQVGTICIVQFLGAPGTKREAFISHFCGTSNQSLPHGQMSDTDNLFPQQAQAVTVFNEQGEPTEEFRSRLQATESESPRWTRAQNGSTIEIDNRSNINVQASINREPIRKERYRNYQYQQADILETPDPEGNVMLSTRGAKRGNIGLVTGKIKTTRLTTDILGPDGSVVKTVVIRDDVDAQNEEGNILLSTVGASVGDINATAERDINASAQNINGDADKSVNVDAGTSVHVTAGTTVQVDAAGNITIRVAGGKVLIGKTSAIHPVVLGDVLLEWIITIVMLHFHYGVTNGKSVTGPSNIIPPDMLSTTVLVSQ